MEAIAILIVLVLLGFTAWRWGVDSTRGLTDWEQRL